LEKYIGFCSNLMSLSYGDESPIRSYILVVGMGWDA
jgi:hypothetical protein